MVEGFALLNSWLGKRQDFGCKMVGIDLHSARFLGQFWDTTNEFEWC